MTNLDLTSPVYYQSTKRFNGNSFIVNVLSINGSNAKVKTQGEQKIEFNCKVSSLFN